MTTLPIARDPVAADVPAFPSALVTAMDNYRDRCRRGGDSVPERVALETAIHDYAAALVLRALDVAMPERPGDDAVLLWLDESIITATYAERYECEHAGRCIGARSESEFWAREGRMLRVIRERLTREAA